jgi:hypothetical protein
VKVFVAEQQLQALRAVVAVGGDDPDPAADQVQPGIAADALEAVRALQPIEGGRQVQQLTADFEVVPVQHLSGGLQGRHRRLTNWIVGELEFSVSPTRGEFKLRDGRGENGSVY